MGVETIRQNMKFYSLSIYIYVRFHIWNRLIEINFNRSLSLVAGKECCRVARYIFTLNT